MGKRARLSKRFSKKFLLVLPDTPQYFLVGALLLTGLIDTLMCFALANLTLNLLLTLESLEVIHLSLPLFTIIHLELMEELTEDEYNVSWEYFTSEFEHTTMVLACTFAFTVILGINLSILAILLVFGICRKSSWCRRAWANFNLFLMLVCLIFINLECNTHYFYSVEAWFLLISFGFYRVGVSRGIYKFEIRLNRQTAINQFPTMIPSRHVFCSEERRMCTCR